jgi:hypothetical protein
MKRKSIIIIVGSLVAAIALMVLYYLYGGSTAPAGQPALVRLDSSNLVSLKDDFNGASNSVRLIVMLSPT